MMMEDLLYERLAAKIEKEAFPGGKPVDAPLIGIEEAVAIMEQVAEDRINAKTRGVSWKFFTSDGKCVAAPCPTCVQKATPLRTPWWQSVCDWQKKQNKRFCEINNEFGEEAAEIFANEETDECDNHLRAAIHDAWKSKHPKLSGGWDEDCKEFKVEF